MKHIVKFKLVLVFLFLSFLSNSQIFIISTIRTKPGPNSAQTEAHYKFSEEMTQKTKEALEAKDFEKAIYYLDQWSHRSKGVNVNFYVLLAQYCTETKDYSRAKRNYKKAYKKWACYECKEKMEQLPKE
ncbi:MAG: hypothetical protein H7239_12945 [Flavobacterium sp.]|nr:hypothetical protein [Flavobacterium sp.]